MVCLGLDARLGLTKSGAVPPRKEGCVLEEASLRELFQLLVWLFFACGGSSGAGAALGGVHASRRFQACHALHERRQLLFGQKGTCEIHGFGRGSSGGGSSSSSLTQAGAATPAAIRHAAHSLLGRGPCSPCLHTRAAERPTLPRRVNGDCAKASHTRSVPPRSV